MIFFREKQELYRDRVAEETVKLVFNESILAHMNNISSPVRQVGSYSMLQISWSEVYFFGTMKEPEVVGFFVF